MRYENRMNRRVESVDHITCIVRTLFSYCWTLCQQMRQSWAQAFCTFVFLHFNRDAEPKAWPPTGSCDSDLKQICRLNLTLKVPGGKHKVLEVIKSKTKMSWRKSTPRTTTKATAPFFIVMSQLVTTSSACGQTRLQAQITCLKFQERAHSRRLFLFFFTYRSFGHLFLTCI